MPLLHNTIPPPISSLMLLALLQTLTHNAIEDPARLSYQLMQLQTKLASLGRIVLLPVLLTLESSTNRLEDIDDFFAQLVAGVLDESFDFLFDFVGDGGEGPVETDDLLFKVGVADVTKLLTCEWVSGGVGSVVKCGMLPLPGL